MIGMKAKHLGPIRSRDISSSEEGKLRFELIMGEKLNAIIA
jgi:hypothetical protein